MDYSPAFNDFQFDQSEHYASPMSLPPSRTPRGDDRASMIYRPSRAENPAPSNHPATPQSVPVHEPVSTVPLTPRTVDPIRLQPTLQNIVSTVNLGCRLDLKRIAHQAGNAEYNPKRFSAVIMRIRNPRTTLLIFESGKLVCTGAKTVEDSNRGARRGARIIQKLGFDAKFLEFRIQNMVASVDVNFNIRLAPLCIKHPEFCRFEPEIFPGLIYRIENPKIVLLIFDSGKVILTGAKTTDTIYKAFDLIYPVLKGFRRS